MPDKKLGFTKCTKLLEAAGFEPMPGRTLRESATALCMAASVHKAATDNGLTPEVVLDMTTSRYPMLSKTVEGGFKHVISVDNGALYAELWSKGDNWYAVTGAAISLVDGIKKGMDATDAVPLFLKAVFPGKHCCGGR
jgi:hypothetical protein